MKLKRNAFNLSNLCLDLTGFVSLGLFMFLSFHCTDGYWLRFPAQHFSPFKSSFFKRKYKFFVCLC